MTDEEKRVKIAEACGWHHIFYDGPDLIVGHRKFQLEPDVNPEPVPDYFANLNAIYEAERLFFDSYDRSKWFRYLTHLQNVCCCGGNATHEDHVHATAAQRSEAFLRTICDPSVSVPVDIGSIPDTPSRTGA